MLIGKLEVLSKLSDLKPVKVTTVLQLLILAFKEAYLFYFWQETK